MGAEGRGPGGKVGPPPCSRGGWSGPSEPLPPTSPPEAPLAPAPVDDDPGSEPGGYRCDLCGGPMLDRHCKLLCLSCGYQRDCSDP